MNLVYPNSWLKHFLRMIILHSKLDTHWTISKTTMDCECCDHFLYNMQNQTLTLWLFLGSERKNNIIQCEIAYHSNVLSFLEWICVSLRRKKCSIFGLGIAFYVHNVTEKNSICVKSGHIWLQTNTSVLILLYVSFVFIKAIYSEKVRFHKKVRLHNWDRDVDNYKSCESYSWVHIPTISSHLLFLLGIYGGLLNTNNRIECIVNWFFIKRRWFVCSWMNSVRAQGILLWMHNSTQTSNVWIECVNDAKMLFKINDKCQMHTMIVFLWTIFGCVCVCIFPPPSNKIQCDRRLTTNLLAVFIQSK